MKALEENSYYSGPYVKNFLKEFGGLIIRHPHFKLKASVEEVHFNPIVAIPGIYREKVEEYEEAMGMKLALIGEAETGHMFLLLAENGAVFGGYDGSLILLGKSGYEAIQTLCDGSSAETVWIR